MSAVKHGAFSETLIAYHPGVTTMWIAGLRTFFTTLDVNIENLAQARWLIGIVVSAGISIACVLLYSLFGRWVALASFASLAYSPIFLAQTRRVHTDALAAIFILLAVLMFLRYCQNRQQLRYLVFSGITFGLSLLTKSYALILLPCVPLCLLLFREKRGKHFLTSIAELIFFLNCSVLTILSLWPIFWTLPFGFLNLCLLATTHALSKELKKETISLTNIPLWTTSIILIAGSIRILQTIWMVLDSIDWALTTPHNVQHLFLGKIVNDPGWFFYPVVLTIKSTPLMLPLALIGCILLWKRRKYTEKTSQQFRAALALVSGVVLFTICLSITSKKFPRYLLPAFLMLEILAAIGFVRLLQWGSAWLKQRFNSITATLRNSGIVAVCLIVFFIQIFPALASHPYYGTYYNPCWKVTDITKIITVGDASGLDLAAKYLNQKDNATQMHIVASFLANEFLGYYFSGDLHFAKPVTDSPPIKYEVVYIRDSQIGWPPQTGIYNGELEHVITLNGIDHVWIYRVENL